MRWCGADLHHFGSARVGQNMSGDMSLALKGVQNCSEGRQEPCKGREGTEC
jgi:hypothetical protein